MSKCFRTPNFLDFMMIKGSLVRKPPRYGRLSCLAFAASWQPHHHLNHSVHDITMSTTSSPSSCQVVGKCKFHFDSLLSNPPRIPISKLVPIAISYFRNVRPGACRALPGMVYQWSQWRRHLQLEFLLPKMCWMMLNPFRRHTSQSQAMSQTIDVQRISNSSESDSDHLTIMDSWFVAPKRL